MKNANIKGKSYEEAILEKLMYEFGDNLNYIPNYFIKGEVRNTKTEFDIAIFRKNQRHPFWVIECKNWIEKLIKSKLIKEIESYPTKLKNLKSLPEIVTFIVPHKPSKGSINTANRENIDVEIITRAEAKSRNWRNVAHSIYPYDICFHSTINKTILYINNKSFKEAIYEMENIAYEEWLDIVRYSLTKYKETTKQLLKCIAEFHHDSGWRFNAIQILFENYQLRSEYIKVLLSKECDEEVKQLLLEYL